MLQMMLVVFCVYIIFSLYQFIVFSFLPTINALYYTVLVKMIIFYLLAKYLMEKQAWSSKVES